MEADHDYFARKANEERAAADLAATPEIRAAHLALSERYSSVAKALSEQSRSIAKRYGVAPDFTLPVRSSPAPSPGRGKRV